ncbi:unnamed protein product, partial [Gulo gulo]
QGLVLGLSSQGEDKTWSPRSRLLPSELAQPSVCTTCQQFTGRLQTQQERRELTAARGRKTSHGQVILIQHHLVLFMEGKRPPISTAGEEIFQRCCPAVLLTFFQHRGPPANDQRSSRNLKTKYVFRISPSLWI